MGIPPDNRKGQDEIRKRKREAVIIVCSLLLIAFLTWVELRLTRLSGDVPMSSNITIFALINVIILLIIILVYLIFRNAAKLLMERRDRVIGARLRTKLVLAFITLSLVPTMLLFFVSAGYITNSIQNWFNKEVETSLTESMEVAQTHYKNSAANALFYGNRISEAIREQRLINEESLPDLKELIRLKQKEYNLSVVEVYSSQREELVRVGNPDLPKAEFTNPSSEDIDAGLKGKELTRVSPVGKADLIRGIVPIRSTFNKADVVGVVVVNYYVPYSLVAKVREIEKAYQEFRQLKILKNPITTGYILTLFLITLFIIFMAVWFGLYLARSLTIPLQELAEATRAVAEGNLDVHLGEKGTDEIGMLVASFNTMTDDLREKQQALDQRRRYMETVLKSVSAGVVSIDGEGNLTTVNRTAERLLGVRSQEVLGKNFREVLRPVYLEMVKGFLRDTIRKQVTVPARDGVLTLQINLSMLRDDNDEFIGTVVVLDDMSQLVKAQRMAAWREVARRIAHEIKNPLTPIQLSAQRLRKRFLGRLGSDQQVFDDCTDMIVRSVDELKTLVDEFSRFARMPAAQPQPNSLNDIIRQALTLFQEAHRSVTFTFLPDETLPPLQLDHDQMKRVLINLLDNAVAALGGAGEVKLSTSYNPELRLATCEVADTGHGIAPEDRPRLFEPYFSTKKSGTGLGLAIVNTIIADHHGFIRVKDNTPQGTRFIIELPVATA
jgi:two-component system nitrogen regulation sensor histidine kinase NtrY